jgi:hypothetical protein
VEEGPVEELLQRPSSNAARRLLAAEFGVSRAMLNESPR